MSDHRVFVAVDLPDELTGRVAEVQDRFDGIASLSFTKPTQAHITVKFLGETTTERIDNVEEAVQTAVAEADTGPFESEIGGLGVFPSTDYIRVIWAGVREGTAELTRLHEAVERETTELGFETEDHEFTPHLTLARMSDARGKARVREIVGGLDPTIGRMSVEAVKLKESELTDEGPEHRTLARIPL